MIRELKKGNLALYIAGLMNSGPKRDRQIFKSVKRVQCDEELQKGIEEYADLFSQELPEELLSKRHLNLQFIVLQLNIQR